MKQVKRRTTLIALLVLLLLSGTVIFCAKYALNGRQWAAFSANEHAYAEGRLSAGRILDRNGILLYDAAEDLYAEDSQLREATLHAVGDPGNNISTSAKAALAHRLIGYSFLTGTATGGHDLYLTIDAQLNRAAYEALAGRKGVVAVYNYRTGEILCMVSAPAFDPADPSEVDDDSRYEGVYLNRFLSATYPPGSVFKLVTAAAALENIPDLSDRVFSCSGSTEIEGGCVTCPYPHGQMDFRDAMACSCNGVFARLAVELGGDTLRRYAESAGLLDGHTVSGIPTAAGSFSVGTGEQLGWSGVGQHEDLMNPCSLLTLMGAIANDGTAAQPQLVARETAPGGIFQPAEERTVTQTVWCEDTCRALREMMRNNVIVTYGQERFGQLPVCAKSGTAEVGDGQTPHAWFCGFVDDPDRPLAFVVLVENGGGGADVAGSVAAAVLRQVSGE